MGVSKNNGTPKSSIFIGFSIINHPFWGVSPYFWKHPYDVRGKNMGKKTVPNKQQKTAPSRFPLDPPLSDAGLEQATVWSHQRWWAMVVVWVGTWGKSFVGLQTLGGFLLHSVICWLFCITGFLIFFSISTSEHFVACEWLSFVLVSSRWYIVWYV